MYKRQVAEQPPASLQLDGLVKRADGSGLATTKWDRFRLAVSDFFSFASTVKARQDTAVVQFKQALRREYGPELGDLSLIHI